MELQKPELSIQQGQILLDKAEAAKQNTYPESGSYAATALTDKGNMYNGVAYKSATHTLTMHAEATALANAAIHGEKNVIAITGPNCHICKQLIWESALNSGVDIQIVIKEGDAIKFVSISELMPYPWPDEKGNK
jgi:cytidine deaminase